MRRADSTAQPACDPARRTNTHTPLSSSGLRDDPFPILERPPTSQPPPDAAHRVEEFIRNHLHEGLTLKDLARFLGYSDKYCSDLFKALTGIPFSHYLKRLRLERAVGLLAESNATLSSIAEALGFSDQFAFSHFFKNAVGCSPQRFRSQCFSRRLRLNPPRDAWPSRRSKPPIRR